MRIKQNWIDRFVWNSSQICKTIRSIVLCNKIFYGITIHNFIRVSYGQISNIQSSINSSKVIESYQFFGYDILVAKLTFVQNFKKIE